MVLRIAAAVLLGGVLASSGACVRAESQQSAARDAAAQSLRPAVMPNLVGKTVTQAGEVLGSTNVYVVFPSVDVTWSAPAEYVAGTHLPARGGTLTIPSRVKDIESLLKAVEDTHAITAQAPAPGSALTLDTTVTLTAGRHPGAPRSPWFNSHALVVQTRGANACFDCHSESDCNDCHLAIEHKKQ